jgi:hypothetical protein
MHARRASAPQIRVSSYVPCHLHVSRLLSCLSLQLWTSTPRILAPRLAISAPWFELRVHFSKSFQKGHICEILSPKGPKGKKSRYRRHILVADSCLINMLISSIASGHDTLACCIHSQRCVMAMTSTSAACIDRVTKANPNNARHFLRQTEICLACK